MTGIREVIMNLYLRSHISKRTDRIIVRDVVLFQDIEFGKKMELCGHTPQTFRISNSIEIRLQNLLIFRLFHLNERKPLSSS